MIKNREIALNLAKDQDERVFLSKVWDKSVRCWKLKEQTNTDFMDPLQRSLALKLIKYVENQHVDFYGGFEQSERVILIFRPSFIESCNKDMIKVIQIEVNGTGLTHRDYLGSFMGLGIKREKIGDILVNENGCSAFVMEDISDYILYNLTKIGRFKSKVSVHEPQNTLVKVENALEDTKTVASLRLDCVIGSGLNLSRSQAEELIRAQRVFVNWEVITSLSKSVNEGDTISVRGKGRIVIKKINGLTKKGRLSVNLCRYI